MMPNNLPMLDAWLIGSFEIGADCDGDENVVDGVDGGKVDRMMMKPLESVDEGKVNDAMEEASVTSGGRYLDELVKEFSESVEADEVLRSSVRMWAVIEL